MADFCVEEMTGTDGKKDLGSRIAPSSLEMVAAVVVIVQSNNGIIARKPGQPIWRTQNCPPVLKQGLDRVRKQMLQAE
jgi:hypothetical protein